MRISVMITAFNEEQFIENCLKSVAGAVDEIVVVHGGQCRDNTLNIAIKYTGKVFVDKDYGVACPNRPFGFAQCTGDWVLQLDADERVSDELKKNLRALAEADGIDAYEFRWLHQAGDLFVFGQQKKSYKPVFFRKSKLINEGIVHEPTRTSGVLVRSEYVLHHDQAIDPSIVNANLPKKLRLWPKIDAEYRIDNGKALHSKWLYLAKAPVWFVAYILFYYVYQLYIFGGKRGLQDGFNKAMYNFRLNYYLFKLK